VASHRNILPYLPSLVPSTRRQPVAKQRSFAARSQKRITQSQFTEKGWQAIIAAPQVQIHDYVPQLSTNECRLRMRLPVGSSLMVQLITRTLWNVPVAKLMPPDDLQEPEQARTTNNSEQCPRGCTMTHVPLAGPHGTTPAELVGRNLVQVATKYSHQTVESEHLIAALLEQSNGLARRILEKCDANPSSVLNKVDEDLRQMPKVSGTSDQVLGRNLEAMITAAEALKGLWKDDFVSVEHLVIAAVDDPHYGARLCRQFGLTKNKVEKAVKDIRGSKRVSGVPTFFIPMPFPLPLPAGPCPPPSLPHTHAQVKASCRLWHTQIQGI
jgi:hypothetical protein